ncbi:MAG: anhydro-N-acetylmuramic acid kinase [Gammaproteobacteria bacterium]|nr:MAG: anhydro-N-acetylmuramic acid kinase [Gammaproteobacteria bacterium]
MSDALVVGLMSGTSVDAVDSALVRVNASGVELLNTHEHAIPPATRQRIAAVSHTGPDEIERMGELDRELGLLFGEAALVLLEAADTRPHEVTAIGSHGQTIRHRPPSGATNAAQSFTLQIGDPNTIAENTGITTVADFRRRDIAAGGEGAPLAPAFHAAAFTKKGVNRAIANIGGIANVTLLEGQDLHSGFDTGPGNTLLDHWVMRHQGKSFDRHGQWSAEGEVIAGSLQRLLQHPYFQRSGPRSTGVEVFNLDWVDNCLAESENLSPRDVQATLAEFTAITVANAIQHGGVAVSEVYICGGGAHNTDLMRRLYHKLAPAQLDSTSVIGMDPDWVEAATFAWLASRTLSGLPGNAPVVTGAEGLRILGGIYPG